MPAKRTSLTALTRNLLEGLLVLFLLWIFIWCLRIPGISHEHRAISSVPTPEKVVALTYDDGPHPIYTPQILAVLKKYHVHATFFMIGSRMERYPAIVKAAAAQGHDIENHTYTHPENIRALNAVQIVHELDQCQQIIVRLTGKTPHCFRPPLGNCNRDVFKLARDDGYATVLWTVCGDHHDAPTPQLMAQRILRRIRPGAIILLHDGRIDARWKDVAATPIIIEALQRKGYRFVTVPELLQIPARH